MVIEMENYDGVNYFLQRSKVGAATQGLHKTTTLENICL